MKHLHTVEEQSGEVPGRVCVCVRSGGGGGGKLLLHGSLKTSVRKKFVDFMSFL